MIDHEGTNRARRVGGLGPVDRRPAGGSHGVHLQPVSREAHPGGQFAGRASDQQPHPDTANGVAGGGEDHDASVWVIGAMLTT